MSISPGWLVKTSFWFCGRAQEFAFLKSFLVVTELLGTRSLTLSNSSHYQQNEHHLEILESAESQTSTQTY